MGGYSEQVYFESHFVATCYWYGELESLDKLEEMM